MINHVYSRQTEIAHSTNYGQLRRWGSINSATVALIALHIMNHVTVGAHFGRWTHFTALPLHLNHLKKHCVIQFGALL